MIYDFMKHFNSKDITHHKSYIIHLIGIYVSYNCYSPELFFRQQ